MNLAKYEPKNPPRSEIPFLPARVLLQDFTGVPCVVDLAAMRSAIARMGGDPKRINPLIPADLVIDHSVQVDVFNSPLALMQNARIEFERNRERYEFLKWGQSAFDNFRVIPPRSGICHQVNLEYLGKVVERRKQDGRNMAFPDSLVGLDSHTPMINGLGIVGWGVGGIEAEAVMLGQPLYMLPPPVVGVKLTGRLQEGVTATDMVLTVTERLRKKGVVDKFVEFYGEGLSSMTVPDRATISNMSPEFGATIAYFPVDEQTLAYLKGTGRSKELIGLIERYMKEQGLFRTDSTPPPEFQETLELDLSEIEPSLAGPKRPQDRLPLSEVKKNWQVSLKAPLDKRGFALDDKALSVKKEIQLESGEKAEITHGSVVIAAITSCTNTSNPSVMIAAGLLAKKAVEAGLNSKPWVKTSLAPGSMVVTEYLTKSGLLPYLEKLGFFIVGYGCTTCIGNSGPLPEPVRNAVKEGSLVVASVLSGNRNFEGRIHSQVKASFLASPPLVIAYALAGTMEIDMETEPLGVSKSGKEVFLKDIFPTSEEISRFLSSAYDPETFNKKYESIESSNEEWNNIPLKGGELYEWSEESTYIQEPPFFIDMPASAEPIVPIKGARVLAKVGDSVTTDHISPAGAISPDSPAGKYLIEHGVQPKDFNSFGSRRGNDRVMTRGTFGNPRFRNELAPDKEGGFTVHIPSGEPMTIYEASLRYKEEKRPLIVFAGKDYGMGSSRDWAAKGVNLLGVKAVIAESFERIHRSNLVGMGVLPLEFENGENAKTLGLTGLERYDIKIDDSLKPNDEVLIVARDEEGVEKTFTTRCRLDTPVEVEYYRNGGILHTVLRRLLKEGA
ncbi:MAG: aconitate hydratase AcnA [Myxococcota bacterium]